MQTEKTLNLVERLKKLVAEERRITKEILVLLNEMEEQRIYAEMGYPSLFQFCTDYLGYSEGAAGRRVSAARLLRGNGNLVAAKIESGELSISTASRIQRYLRKGKKPAAEVKGLVEELAGKSQREVEQILVEREPELLRSEVVRPKTATHAELRVNLSRESEKKLEKLRAYYAHKGLSMGELIEELIEKELARVEKDKFGNSRERTSPASKPCVNKAAPLTSQAKLQVTQIAQALQNTQNKKPWKYEHTNQRRPLPKLVRQEIYKTAQGQCEYVSPVTRERCNSKFLLQIEHKKPLAKNGTNTRANLELLCRAHNLLRRDQQMSLKK